VSKAFKKDFRKTVEKSNPYVFEKKQLDDDIDDALDLFIATQTVQNTSIITNTTQRESEAALLKAVSELLEEEIQLTDEVVASRTTEIFRRKINFRAETIATTETQNAAEGTKSVEVETVVRSPEVEEVEVVEKTWEAILDGKERDTHFEADGQVVRVEENFTVGNSQLRFPGDSSQGAEAEEVINCRCSATYLSLGVQ